MRLGLGVDTGGTYTDSVLLDLEGEEILSKNKALTTYSDLSEGIADSIAGLTPVSSERIRLVSISTTLATNAIVEGRGGRAGLLSLGWEPEVPTPASESAVLPGAFDAAGRETEPLDPSATLAAIHAMKDKVDGFAVSGYFAVADPSHELEVARLLREQTNLPVVCGHQLSAHLGMTLRSITAVLNVRLLSLIAELIDAVKRVLADRGITAPLMVVRGNGSLMNEAVARERPVETVLSGPAASIVGAQWLLGKKDAPCGLSDAIVVDMGGTTTDIAIVESGRPALSSEGATVGGWRTRVAAADISTFGLGGDSHVRTGDRGEIRIGPRRVTPLCVAAVSDPTLIDRLAEAPKLQFLAARRGGEHDVTAHESQVLEALRDGPKTLRELARALGTYPALIRLERLDEWGLIGRVGLTPTDLLHAEGSYLQWDRRAAQCGVDLGAERSDRQPEEFCRDAHERLTNDLARAVLSRALLRDMDRAKLATCETCEEFLEAALGTEEHPHLRVAVTVNKPLVGIGAPSRAFLPEVANRLGTNLVLPEHAEVANAIGAIVSKVVESVPAQIIPRSVGGYRLLCSHHHANFDTYAEAVAEAERLTSTRALECARRSGGDDLHVHVALEERWAPLAEGYGDKILVEATVTATAIGLPAMEPRG